MIDLFGTLVVVVIVILNLMNASEASKKSKKDTTNPGQYERSPKVQEYYAKHPDKAPKDVKPQMSEQVHQKPPVKQEPESSYNEDKSFRKLEDRDNDWLAQQLAEERRSLIRISDMLDLKLSHEADCEAKTVRRYSYETQNY